MSFAVPAAMLLGALSLPIIGLYILRVRLRRVPVSTNMFWRQVYQQRPPRSLWRRLRHLVSLLVQLLLLWLLVLAIADPHFLGQRLAARRIVIVLDGSASMQATDLAPSRFDAARRAARRSVADLRLGDEMALVLAGSRPEVLLGMTGHIPTLRRALDAAAGTDGPADLSAAIDAARRLIGDHPRGQVHVCTDGCVEPAELERLLAVRSPDAVSTGAETGNAPPVEIRIFGSQAGNVGIVRLQVRRNPADPLGYEILAAVKNASDSPVRCRLEIALDDAPVDILPLRLKPNETWSHALEKTSLGGGRLTATLTRIGVDDAADTGSQPELGPANADQASSPALAVKKLGQAPSRPPIVQDFGRSHSEPVPFFHSRSAANVNALAIDDTAWAILPPRIVQPVLLVSPGNLFLQKVFEANPLVQVQTRRELDQTPPPGAILVLHRHVPSVLPPGNLLVIDPVEACDWWELGEAVRNPIVTDQDRDSPLMTHIRLDHVLLPEIRRLRFSRPSRVLAATLDGDPLLVQFEREEGKCLVLNVDLERSDLAFRTAFPILVSNALAWFAGSSGELRESSRAGAMVTLLRDPLPSPGGDRLWLSSPSGQRFRLAASDSPVTVGPLNEVGIWTIGPGPDGSEQPAEALDDPPYELAVNLADGRETDVRTPLAWDDHRQSPQSTAGWLGRPLWFQLVLAACLLTTCEWFLYQRRWLT
jgi:hypothetical protein